MSPVIPVRRVVPLRVVVCVLLLGGAVAAAAPQNKAASGRIVAATNVTLRALPSTTLAQRSALIGIRSGPVHKQQMKLAISNLA